ncbi:Uncharacterized conserved protein [Cohaesibacter sp. ES.047]|uniref:GFA family protein n=1 Tax=Cohaesibacter sp. ES.047 TaxID=1798205 RepID=UPI000BB85021|nr:GFA family protein [Cohaesibacter sp. ES.047]SNY92498.1 Uncharacterized conserved protein [Cohaesibacter sp. ES.047]
MSEILHGRCLCGAVEFECDPGHEPMTMCHCKQCRQWSGHAWPSISVPVSSLKVTKGHDQIKWFISSEFAKRGFCSDCGSSLFWHPDRHSEWKDEIAVSAGTIEDFFGRKLAKHIFVASKGNYYDITDKLVQEDD